MRVVFVNWRSYFFLYYCILYTCTRYYNVSTLGPKGLPFVRQVCYVWKNVAVPFIIRVLWLYVSRFTALFASGMIIVVCLRVTDRKAFYTVTFTWSFHKPKHVIMIHFLYIHHATNTRQVEETRIIPLNTINATLTRIIPNYQYIYSLKYAFVANGLQYPRHGAIDAKNCKLLYFWNVVIYACMATEFV